MVLMRDYVLIYINGSRHEIRGEAAFQPLSTYLRDTLHLTGTKIVCAEGDCGSCTVLLGAPVSGRIAHKPVCGCIQYLYQLDCTHVITIEGLKYEGQLNPIQDSMVRNHGAQCGFCTPGFVVAACSLWDGETKPNVHAVRRGLVGMHAWFCRGCMFVMGWRNKA
jgi:xanthine dehydrogenase small subunit